MPMPMPYRKVICIWYINQPNVRPLINNKYLLNEDVNAIINKLYMIWAKK